jgi:hypothetical protein
MTLDVYAGLFDDELDDVADPNGCGGRVGADKLRTSCGPDRRQMEGDPKRLYAAERGARPLIGVAVGVCQSTPEWSSSRSR